MIRFILNNQEVATSLPAGETVLDFIRYHKHLTGTKIGCREGDCGACTVLVGELMNGEMEYRSMTSCLMPLGNANGKHIVTIEGINFEKKLNPVQVAMAEEGATQCGFCTPGFVMSLAFFCLSKQSPTKENAIAAVDGNICRCTGYKSIERACSHVADMLKERNGAAIDFVTEKKILPEYFATIKARLLDLKNGQLSVTNDQSIAVGGGTDLYVQKHDEMKRASIQFLFGAEDLNFIRQEENELVFGPSVTVTDLRNSELFQKIFPQFQQYSWLVSSTPIRNMATIAGNFVNASPIGDFTIFFLVLNAKLTLVNGGKERKIYLRDLYKGYKQLDKQPSEIISEIRFQIPSAHSKFNFEKISKRTNLDIASVNSAMLIEEENGIIKSCAISAGGVGPVPMYLRSTSSFFTGQPVSEQTILSAIKLVQLEISPISDARGSAEYKRLLLAQLIKAHFLKLFPGLSVEELIMKKS
ncbi:MAG: (2Fe-2S)-binding protein [Chitinophagaceae bacterium]|mgnify:CR=1 FL=1